MVCNKDCLNCQYDDCILDDVLKDRKKTYYQNHIDKYKANARRWQKENKEKQTEYCKRWYEKNKEHRTEYMKRYWQMKKEQKANDKNCIATDNSAT